MGLCCRVASATGALYADDAVVVFFQEFATDSKSPTLAFEIKDEATFRDQHM